MFELVNFTKPCELGTAIKRLVACLNQHCHVGERACSVTCESEILHRQQHSMVFTLQPVKSGQGHCGSSMVTLVAAIQLSSSTC